MLIRQAIELDATNHVFFSNRSAAYLSQGEADKALADGEACIKVNPTWAKGYSRKGAALQSLKRFDEAIATFNEGTWTVCGALSRLGRRMAFCCAKGFGPGSSSRHGKRVLVC